ncbi:hypothetical protein [Thermogutta sp.]
MDRRTALRTFATSLLGGWLLQRTCSADTPEWLNPEVLKASLHTATPEEEGFIAYVVGLVKAGRLPAEILQSAYLWAKRKPKYKFQYFKRAIIQLAAARGIRL